MFPFVTLFAIKYSICAYFHACSNRLLTFTRALLFRSTLVTFSVLSLLNNTPAFGQGLVQLNEEDILVVQLAVGDYTDDEPLFIYQSPERTLIPIGSVSSVLDIAIEADVDELFISGWRLNEANTIEIELESKTYYIGGQRQEWDPDSQYADDGFDIYLDLRTAQKLLGLKFSIDVAQLQLRVKEDASIPLIAKIERERRREKIEKTSIERNPKNYLPNTYQWASMPQFDFSAGTDFENNRGQRDARYNLVLQGRADLAKHSLQTSYIDNDGEEDLRLTFSRASEGPDKTIALGIDRYEVGDVFGLSDPLLYSSVQGRGIHLSRGGRAVLDQGDTITLQGDAPPNWEVELYRNGSLIEFDETSSDGRYEFNEVPVFIGENIFEVRLYGPQGQFREVREVVSAGGAMLQTGEWEYDAWALRRNKRLIDSSINNSEPESNFLLAEARYGFNRFLSARFGASKMTPNSSTEERKHFFASLYGSVSDALAQLYFAGDEQGGQALQANIQTRFLRTNINADLSLFDELISDRNTNGNLESEYGVRLDRSNFLGLSSAVRTDLDLRRRTLKTGDSNLTSALRLSTGWAGYQFANSLNYTRTAGSSSGERTDGQFSATRKWHGWRYKGSIDYDVAPIGRLSGISLGASHKFGSKLNYTGSITQRFSGKDTFSSDNTLTWAFERFSVSGSTGFNDRGFQYVGLTLTSSLGYDEHNQHHYFSNDSTVSSASLSARVFIDENNNASYDAGEETVPNVRFKGKSKWRQLKTDENGVVLLSGLESLSMEKLEIDEKSIEDPFLKVSKGPIHIYTHSGRTVHVDMPLAMTFELEGRALYDNVGEEKPLSRAHVLLLDMVGEVVDVARVEYDGVYLFTGLVPGDYCIKVRASDLDSYGLAISGDPMCFVANGDDGVVFADDLIFESK